MGVSETMNTMLKLISFPRKLKVHYYNQLFKKMKVKCVNYLEFQNEDFKSNHKNGLLFEKKPSESNAIIGEFL